MASNVIEIYTDGACSGNPGPGGWGAFLRYQNHERRLSGFEPLTTNNRMELIAVISALKALRKPCQIVLTTDSKYVQEGITKWIHHWKQHHWCNARKKPVKNSELWRELDKLVAVHEITWKWVKGHNQHPENELVDALARAAILSGKTV